MGHSSIPFWIRRSRGGGSALAYLYLPEIGKTLDAWALSLAVNLAMR